MGRGFKKEFSAIHMNKEQLKRSMLEIVSIRKNILKTKNEGDE